jgi:protein TonB
VGAIALAVTLHLVVGGASMSIRPAKRATVSTTSVAVESPPEVLAEDIPAVPPPTTTPPPPPPATSPNRPAAANAAPSTSPAAAAVPPGLQPTSFAAGGSGAGGGGFGAGGGQALPSSTPQAKTTVSPTVTPARAVSRPPPRYPPAARRDGLTGVVTLAIQVGEQGSILAVRVVDSDPVGVFDAAALESVRAWRFEPATRDGVPVTTWVRQTIRFTLEAS